MRKKPCTCGECRSIVSTRSAPAVWSRSAISRAVIEMRGRSFLSERAYGKYGSTAVMRPAEACFNASIVISSSRMPSETGVQEGWITNTSASRTFSSICTSRFSFEKRTTVEWQRSMPRCLQMSRASSGWALPPITLISPIMGLLEVSNLSNRVLPRDLGPAVAQRDGAIPDGRAGARVRVHAEVPEPLELHARAGRRGGEAGLEPGALHDLERTRVQAREEIGALGHVHRILDTEQHVVEPHLDGLGMRRREPMDRAPHLAPVGRRAAARVRVVAAAHLPDRARLRVAVEARAGHQVRVAKAHLASGCEAVEALRRLGLEVVGLDPERAREGQWARAGRRILGVV